MKCIILADKAPKKNKTKGWYGNHPINKKYTLIDNQILYLNKSFTQKNLEIIYVYGFDKKNVERHFVNNSKKYKNVSLAFNSEYERFGHSHSLGVGCKNAIDSNLLVFFGTTILKSSYFSDFDIKKSYIFTGNQQGEIGCSIDCFNKIENIAYDLDNGIHEIFHFNEHSIHDLHKLTTSHWYRNHFMFEIINKMIAKNIDFYAKKIDHEVFKR